MPRSEFIASLFYRAATLDLNPVNLAGLFFACGYVESM
jgi:hypothetical protein